jgi:hypothetical protein
VPRPLPYPLDLTGVPKWYLEQAGDYAEEVIPMWAAYEISEILGMWSAGAGDILFRYPVVKNHFEWFVPAMIEIGLRENESARFVESFRAGPALANLQSLVDMRLPNGRLVTLKDIATLRSSEERFADWRRELSDTLRCVNALQGNPEEGWRREAQSIATERLLPEAMRLQRQLKERSLGASFRTGLTTFTLSAAGTGASGLLGSKPAPALAGSAVSGLASAVTEYLKVLKAKRVDRAVLAHFISIIEEVSE